MKKITERFKRVVNWFRGLFQKEKGNETMVPPSPRKRIISKVELWPKEKGDYSYGPGIYEFDNSPVQLGGGFGVSQEPPAPPATPEPRQSYPPFRRSTTENWRSESKMPKMTVKEKYQERQPCKETDSVNPVFKNEVMMKSQADHITMKSQADHFKVESKSNSPRIESRANGPVIGSITSIGHDKMKA